MSPEDTNVDLNEITRDCYLHHRDHRDDTIFIGSVEELPITGKYNFQITRRLFDEQGGFAGVVLVSVDQEALARQFLGFEFTKHGLIELVGTRDRKLRARVPEPEPKSWEEPVVSPLWDLLDRSSEGSYRSNSGVDGVLRTNFYKNVTGLPLVVVTGFRENDLIYRVYERMYAVVLTSSLILVFSLAFALFLTIEARRRDEQERFMSMLSHELKTPLSVIRMAIGGVDVPNSTSARMERAVSDIRNVVERCLQTDRLQYGRISVSNQACRIPELLGHISEASGAPERLVIDCADLPVCWTDGQLLGTIFHNLVDNALKYGRPDGTIRIQARALSHFRTPGVEVAVSNAPGGAGVPDPARVFQRYYREPAAHSKTGSGLGLYISAGLTHLLGGRLRYVARTDEVRFEVWLPIQAPRLSDKVRWTLLSIVE